MRFNSDSMLENFKAERDAIKARIPGALVTTNMMGFYKQLDYKNGRGKWILCPGIITPITRIRVLW